MYLTLNQNLFNRCHLNTRLLFSFFKKSNYSRFVLQREMIDTCSPWTITRRIELSSTSRHINMWHKKVSTDTEMKMPRQTGKPLKS